MALPIVLLLIILVVALLFFSVEWVPADVVALGVLVALIIAGLVPAVRAFAGFGSDTVVMMLGLLILTAALLRTGVVEMAGRTVLRRAGRNPERLVAVIMVAVATLSAFISNTAATAFFLPIALGLAAKAKVSPTKLLMPLAFGSILTSSVTLVSTSTNIVVSGLMTRYHMPPMGMFELAPVGILISIVGLLYMWFVGRRLIPDREAAGELPDSFGLRPYLTEVLILPTSHLVGKTLAESGLGRDLDLTVLQVVRAKNRYHAPRANLQLQAGDTVLVEGRRDEILKIKDVAASTSRLTSTCLLPISRLTTRSLPRL